MDDKVLAFIFDYHNDDFIWSFNSGYGANAEGALFLGDGTPVTSRNDLVSDGVLVPLFTGDNEPVAVYTGDWLENHFQYMNQQYSEEDFRVAGAPYPGGRPTELDYTAGMDTLNPPQPEPEEPEEPEEPGEPGGEEPELPETGIYDEHHLMEFMGSDAPDIETARAAVRAATDLVDNYTRGLAYRRVRYPKKGVNAVVQTVAARLAANPGIVSRRDQAGNFSRSLGAGFNGFNLTEKMALEQYRRTAR